MPSRNFAQRQMANASTNCVGVIAWMHTFSPAKMWLGGLRLLAKPIAHLHTQYNRDLPWDTIDMDFMNLNQSAHGDREFGYMATRLGLNRKVVVGHWQDDDVQARVGAWARAAAAWHDSQRLKIARFGDNMREVAVTEGDKVEAQARFGYSVNGYGVGAEGDWKTAALVRAMKVMCAGLPGGTSFMEDYTYDFGRPAKVLGAHMLEVCPSIAADTPSCEIHPLSIGGKADPVRLVFTAPAGPAVNASIVQIGNRFRMIINEVDVVKPD